MGEDLVEESRTLRDSSLKRPGEEFLQVAGFSVATSLSHPQRRAGGFELHASEACHQAAGDVQDVVAAVGVDGDRAVAAQVPAAAIRPHLVTVEGSGPQRHWLQARGEGISDEPVNEDLRPDGLALGCLLCQCSPFKRVHATQCRGQTSGGSARGEGADPRSQGIGHVEQAIRMGILEASSTLSRAACLRLASNSSSIAFALPTAAFASPAAVSILPLASLTSFAVLETERAVLDAPLAVFEATLAASLPPPLRIANATSGMTPPMALAGSSLNLSTLKRDSTTAPVNAFGSE